MRINTINWYFGSGILLFWATL